MKDQVVLALVSAIEEEMADSREYPLRGKRGLRGAKGDSFIFDDHKEAIHTSLVNYFSENSDFLDKVKGLDGKDGIDGKDGKDGIDGKDGKDFDYKEHRHKILDSLIDHFSKDEDFLDYVKGKDGIDGKDGKDFVFKEHKTEILDHLIDFFQKDQVFLSALKGEDGKDGKDGKDFVFEEHQDGIKEVIHSLRDALKLSFSDLTEKEKKEITPTLNDFGPEEIQELRLTYDKLTEDQKMELSLSFDKLTIEQKEEIKGERGPRGLRGQKGKPGQDATLEDIEEVVNKNVQLLRGPMGLPGVSGVEGRQGPKGDPGQDGQHAPVIEEVELLERRGDEIAIKMFLSDGSTFTTNYVRLPELKQRQNVYVGGGGATSSKKLEVVLLDTDYTIPNNTYTYYEMTVPGLTVELPISPFVGCQIYIANYSNGNGTISSNGATLLGDTSVSLSPGEVFKCLFNGIEWKII